MNKLVSLAGCAILVFSGCTTYRVNQEDLSWSTPVISGVDDALAHDADEFGPAKKAKTYRKIMLRVNATAWFSSAQTIAGIRAQQTDKTQSFGTTALNQAGPSNTVATVEAVTKLFQTLRPTP